MGACAATPPRARGAGWVARCRTQSRVLVQADIGGVGVVVDADAVGERAQPLAQGKKVGAAGDRHHVGHGQL